MTDKYIFYIIIALLVVNVVLSLLKLVKKDKSEQLGMQIKNLGDELEEYTDKSKKDTLDFLARQQSLQNQNRQNVQLMEEARFKAFSDTTQENIDTLRKTVNEMAAGLDGRFAKFQKQNEDQLAEMRKTLEQKVSDMQQSNEKKLDEMRQTVDEKLQKTLEERINQSFKLVSDRLEQVYKSLGEMQKVGEGVNDLRKVLSNVKTRGIFGEVQLGAILEEILSPEQYEANIATKKNSADRVEFAVKLPGHDDGYVYLPIDAKFPLDAYQKLQDAYDSGDKEQLLAARKELRLRIKGFAKDIRTKYIDVPNTTEFAIMFLPLEGLYAEVVREGMVEELQKDKINIAGPTTMAALLNSLQMGFKTLAIQKSSGQVWKVLEEVKTEFGKFGDVLAKTQDRMRQASEELDKLVGTRTNMINRKLRDVSEFSALENNEKNIKKSVDNTLNM
ncbi:MAG: DNA recombination protein RmuC [Oscillospiraceae bacterium]|nr:DNA recombination protein RmuC [Oscillospiraceae bacterium]